MLNLLCIPFLLLLTHPQALSLRLQPELLGRNSLPSTNYVVSSLGSEEQEGSYTKWQTLYLQQLAIQKHLFT